MTINRTGRAKYSNPSRDNYFDFLLRLYFNNDGDPLTLCVRRAYRDMNRTLRGLRKNVKAPDDLREEATQAVVSALKDLPMKDVNSRDAFDRWHEKACNELRSLYRRRFPLSVGQAQKWINMSLKYAFTFGEKRLPGYTHLYEYAHIPIDSIVLKEVAKLGGPTLDTPWSQLKDYRTYLDYQRKCRELFDGSCPLAAEFRLFQESSA